MKSRLLKQLFRGYRKISYRMEKLREVHDIQRQVPPRALQAGVYVGDRPSGILKKGDLKSLPTVQT